MAPKEAPKKLLPPVLRPPISESSLLYVPQDAVEGYQERLETGVEWTLLELGARHHRHKAIDRDFLVQIGFSEALNHQIKKSYLNGFVDDMSPISMQQQWETILPTLLWDNENFATDDEKIIFDNNNCITDDLIKMIHKAVLQGDRQTLRDELKRVEVLRIIDKKMTHLDEGILEFKRLVSLSLCGNYLMDIDGDLLPQTLRSLELQANHISCLKSFIERLPPDLVYLGLAKNLLTTGAFEVPSQFPYHLTVLDMSDNDIYHLNPVLDAVATLPCLDARCTIPRGKPLFGSLNFTLIVCAGYALQTVIKLPSLTWLDARKILDTDKPLDSYEMHADDLRSAYFCFTVLRLMSVPQPPKAEKGATTAFHVELEIPLLDSERRKFLMYRRCESLTEMLPAPEEDETDGPPVIPRLSTKAVISSLPISDIEEATTNSFDIYDQLVTKSSRMINNFTTFESNKIPWAKIMNFQEPTVKIFCPDLVALRNTFRSVITVKVIYSIVNVHQKGGKNEKNKSAHAIKLPTEQRVTLANIKCTLRTPDWTQNSQHFHWDDTLNTNEAIHWGDKDLSVIQYSQVPGKVTKGKQENDLAASTRQLPPDNLTCHFGFGIETRRAPP